MRIVIQRVTSGSVSCCDSFAQIEQGFVVFVGIEHQDDVSDVEWLVNKLIALRVFDDEKGVMNRSIQDVHGEILLISQFTLHARTKKGNRPSYVDAAPPQVSEPLYHRFLELLEVSLPGRVKGGCFGQHMSVSLVNDGPVTLIIDSQNRI